MTNVIKLKQANLPLIPDTVRKPTYDRNQVKTSIVHIGVGNFHRSHEAFLTHRLMEETGDLNNGICGIGLLDHDRRIYNALTSQDGLYTLVIKEMDGTRTAHVVGSIIEFILAPDNPIGAIEKMASPDTKIISMTITEGGYNLNEGAGSFDFTNPVVVEDMKNPLSPKTVFGYLAQAFKLRKERNSGGVTIQSCDNIQNNGQVAKKALMSYITKVYPELVEWVNTHVTFPNSMVDRITPVTVADDIERLADEFQIEDQWPVVCEPFIQWVVEDHYAASRPAWEKVGATFVEDVTPYEHMKLRLLNAGHTVLGMLGALHGYDTIDQSAEDADFSKFLVDYMDKEVSSTLGDLKGIDLEDYKKKLLSRFRNKNIRDQIARICLQSSAKIPIFILSTVNARLAAGQTVERAAFTIAAWCKYNDGIDEKERSYKIDDVMSNELVRVAALSHVEPKAFLNLKAVFGDLNQKGPFVEAFERSLKMIRTHTIKECVQLINKKEENEK